MTAPDPAQLARWVAQSMSGADTKVVSMVPLRPDPVAAPRWMLELDRGGEATRVVLKAGPEAGMRAELSAEAAALTLAAAHGLGTPRLLVADIEGHDAGCPVVLMTYVDGSDQIPVFASRDRLRALGAAAAALHRVALTPTEDLPLRRRHMPWINLSAQRRRGLSPTTPLLERGDRLIRELAAPEGLSVFVHGDLWAGNTLWRDDTCVAIIDWEAAGAGDSGVDVGSLRLDAALLHGPDAPDEVLDGWMAGSEHEPAELDYWVAYWDLVAALNTGQTMAGFVPTMHQAGRTDLDATLLTKRRDDFLASALARVQ